MEEQKDLIKNLIENDKAKPVKDLIISKIEEGQTFKDACVLAGKSEKTGHRWKALSNEEKERIAECATCSYSSEEEINWNEGYWDGISDAGVAIVAMFKAEI